MSLWAIHPGAYYHIESLEGPRYAGMFDRLIRPEELARADLFEADALLIPCRTPADRMIPHAGLLRAFLDAGGFVIATGESDSARFLPGIALTPCETNWWWWLTPGADLGVRIAVPEHPLFAHLGEADLAWHLHGFFDVPRGATVLVTGEGRPILYEDRVTTKGRMIVTSLDPFYHHGSHFMPATTRFLDGLLRWLKEETG